MNKEKFIKFLEKMSIESYIYENTISFDIESSRYPTQHYCINVDESSITRYYGEDDEESEYFESIECNDNTIVFNCNYDGILKQFKINLNRA